MTDRDLDNLSGLPGVTACGICWPGGRMLARQAVTTYPSAQLEQFLAIVCSGTLALQANGIGANCLCWQFERSWIFCGVREDNSVLVLVTSSNPERSAEIAESVRAFAKSA